MVSKILKQDNKGFTIIEMVIVITIFSILVSLTYTNFIRPQRSVNARSIISILRNDVRHQQLKTMFSQNSTLNNSRAHGIYFDSYSYTLYTNSSYSLGDGTNFTVDLPTNFEFSTINFPSGELNFGSVDGSVAGYNPAQNSVTLRNVDSDEQFTLTVNNYGTLTVSTGP
jgi:prepilin-type N-terminal cleavage/methylation domain-containing protein